MLTNIDRFLALFPGTHRFRINRWWCSTKPFSQGGLWWEEIIDTKERQVYFYNNRDHNYRLWKDGDENIRDGWTDPNPTTPFPPRVTFAPDDVIRLAAYYLWLEHGGDALRNWLAAKWNTATWNVETSMFQVPDRKGYFCLDIIRPNEFDSIQQYALYRGYV